MAFRIPFFRVLDAGITERIASPDCFGILRGRLFVFEGMYRLAGGSLSVNLKRNHESPVDDTGRRSKLHHVYTKTP